MCDKYFDISTKLAYKLDNHFSKQTKYKKKSNKNINLTICTISLILIPHRSQRLMTSRLTAVHQAVN